MLTAENQDPTHLEQHSDQMEYDAQIKAEKIAQDFKADVLLDRARLAWCHYGRKQKATQLLEKFCALKPDNIFAKVLLAKCYLESETPHKAVEWIDAAKQKLASSGLYFEYLKERAAEYFNTFCGHEFCIHTTLLKIVIYSLAHRTNAPEDLVEGQNRGPSSGSSALQHERQKKLEDTLANAKKTVEGLEQLIGQKQSVGSSSSQQERQKKLENALGNAQKTVEDLEQLLAENQDPTPMEHDAQTKAQDFKADFILDKATLHMLYGSCDKAIPLLKDFCTLKPDDIFAKVLLAECWTDEGEPRKAKILIDAAKQDLASSTLNFEYFIKSADEYVKMRGDYNRRSTRATLFLQIAIHLLLHQTASPDKQVKGIYECMKMMMSNNPIYEYYVSPNEGENEGEWIKAVYNQLKSVENADPCTKALAESLSCFNIGKSLASVLKMEESVEYFKIGVETMEHQLGPNASKYKHYAYMLRYLGKGYGRFNKHSEAESYYVKAIKAFQEATDFDSDSERESAMEEVESLL